MMHKYVGLNHLEFHQFLNSGGVQQHISVADTLYTQLILCINLNG